jgi:hypothetical protein
MAVSLPSHNQADRADGPLRFLSYVNAFGKNEGAIHRSAFG